MKLQFVIEIEPGEPVAVVKANAERWLERAGRDTITNGERLVERLVDHGVNVSEAKPEVEVRVEP